MKVDSVGSFMLRTSGTPVFAIIDETRSRYVTDDNGDVVKFGSIHKARNYISNTLLDNTDKYRVVGYSARVSK